MFMDFSISVDIIKTKLNSARRGKEYTEKGAAVTSLGPSYFVTALLNSPILYFKRIL